jgi:hypothetical protein
MYPSVAVPANTADVDPWIRKLLDSDVASALKLLNERISSDSAGLEPLVRRMSDFVPCQVAFSSGVGYLRCTRRYKDIESGQYMHDAIYIAQPIPDQLLHSRLKYFDQSVRPLAKPFLLRFAGSGEEMEGTAGHFTFLHWPTASEFGSRNDESFDDWRGARLFYAAMNGDSVFIKPDCSTAWHVIETDAMILIASTLEEFIRIYADFRSTHDVFDSWAYRKFKDKDRTK